MASPGLGTMNALTSGEMIGVKVFKLKWLGFERLSWLPLLEAEMGSSRVELVVFLAIVSMVLILGVKTLGRVSVPLFL